MRSNPDKEIQDREIKSISSIFAHDISTPLNKVGVNADLLLQYSHLIKTALESEEAKDIPVHIKQALLNAPQYICTNVATTESLLQQFKTYISSFSSANSVALSQQSATPALTLARLNVLLVDDEEIYNDITSAVLNKNHDLTYESSGKSALARCQKESFDVILVDIEMPELSGQQTVEELRHLVPESTIILGLSSASLEADKDKLLNNGFDGFLRKPFNISGFSKEVSKILAK